MRAKKDSDIPESVCVKLLPAFEPGEPFSSP